MARKDNSQRINKDITDFNNWRSEIKSVSFTKRSASEIQMAQQIKQRNMIIKQQKEQKKSMEKSKVKTLSKDLNGGNVGSSSGFVNILTLTLIIGFIASAIFIIIYNILK